MLSRAHELRGVDAVLRLEIINSEFPYVSLLQAEHEAQKEKAARLVHRPPLPPVTQGATAKDFCPIVFKKSPAKKVGSGTNNACV